MKKSVNTRTQYRIIGSDYSAQEPRMTAYLSQDKNMLEAYNHGKDLYAMIARAAFDNKYEDNLEFYVPGKVVEVDGKPVVSGSGKEFAIKTNNDDAITIKYYELLETTNGDIAAKDLKIGDKIISDVGQLTICNKVQNNDDITLSLSI